MRPTFLLLVCSFTSCVALAQQHSHDPVQPHSTCDTASKEYTVARKAVLKGESVPLMKLSDRSAGVFPCLLDEHNPDVTIGLMRAGPLLNSTLLAERLDEAQTRLNLDFRLMPVAATIPHWQVLFISHVLDTVTDCTDRWPLDGLEQLVIPLSLTADEFAEATYQRLRSLVRTWRWKQWSGMREEVQIGDALKKKRGVNAANPVDAVKKYPPFLSREEMARADFREVARNKAGDRALVKIYVNNGVLAERWYDVVMHKTKVGWDYESVALTAFS